MTTNEYCLGCGVQHEIGPCPKEEARRIAEELLEAFKDEIEKLRGVIDDNTVYAAEAYGRGWIAGAQAMREAAAQEFVERQWEIADVPEVIRALSLPKRVGE